MLNWHFQTFLTVKFEVSAGVGEFNSASWATQKADGTKHDGHICVEHVDLMKFLVGNPPYVKLRLQGVTGETNRLELFNSMLPWLQTRD